MVSLTIDPLQGILHRLVGLDGRGYASFLSLQGCAPNKFFSSFVRKKKAKLLDIFEKQLST